VKKAKLFKKLDKKKVQCTCCQRKCVIENGRSGFCGVRKNVDGDLYLMVYGKAIAIHMDPIEKKPLYHFLPGSKIFSFGTVGCNFRCSFCQNWDISQITAKENSEDLEKFEDLLEKICNEGQDLSPEEGVKYCIENEIPAIAYTYNEPTIFSEYAHDTGALARKKGIKNVYVSNGYESEECLKYMREFCDAINIDIKSFSQKFYAKECGGVLLEGLKNTIKLAYGMGFWIECTTLIIPGLNDSDKELMEIAKFLADISCDIPWHVTAFHPDYKMTDKAPTPAATLEKAYQIGVRAGLHYIYAGNISGMNHSNTVCPKCGKILVKRGYMNCFDNEIVVGKNGEGKCPQCGEKIAGVWR